LKIYLEEDSPAFGVVANIYDISDRPGKRKNIRGLVIPAGSRGFSEDIELDSGKYIFEAILPSGEIVSEEVFVEDSSEPLELLLFASPTPHEWLSWQHFIGNVAQREAYEAQFFPSPMANVTYRGVEEKATFDVRTDLVLVLTPSPDQSGPYFFSETEMEISRPSSLVSRGYFSAIPSLKNAESTKSLSEFIQFDELDTPALIKGPLTPYDYDEISQVYRTDTGAASFDYRADRFERQYLFIRGEGIPAQYSVVPTPWMQVDGRGEAVVETFVRHTALDSDVSSGVDPGYRMSILVKDGVVGSVIGYLGTGDLPAAATMINEKAKDMIFLKLTNPLAAAAGAYVLLSTQRLSQIEDWQEWVYNLMKWFPWLSDGAIQHAWIKMKQQEMEEARASLLEGYRRGLPFYSKGLSLLLDGLTLFANDARAEKNPDEEVEEALQLVRRLALHTNMRQPFTTILLH
jgi:hypothetical protein